MQRTYLTASLTALAVGALATAGHAAVVDFDQASDFDDFNNLTISDTDGDNYSFDPGDGTDGSGAVGVDGDGAVAHLTSETFDFSQIGTTFTLSQDGFYDASAASTSGGPGIRVGLTGTDATSFGGGVFVQASLLASGDIQIQSRDGGDSDLVSGSPITFSTTDTWYRLVAMFTPTSDGVDITAEVFNIGPTGTGPANSTTSAGSNSLEDNDGNSLTSDTETFAAFKTNSNSGITDLDNFVAVPEPASLALLGLGGLMLLPRRRRRS